MAFGMLILPNLFFFAAIASSVDKSRVLFVTIEMNFSGINELWDDSCVLSLIQRFLEMDILRELECSYLRTMERIRKWLSDHAFFPYL
ncbi:hypothetical protein L218DRAFT_87989 [Marasmius fiardii PR-910]|nr:hypothetical protein L218DRAFT_87989 [Marasmius fiardii PR-910]